MLARKGVSFEEIDIEARPEQREEMIRRSGRRTVPQIFIGERHIGGSDDLQALDAAGGLDPLLRAHPRFHRPKVPKMANEQTPIATDQAAPASQLALQGVYLKDCSFEAPQGPRANGEWNPQISLDLNTNVQPIGGDMREVVLTVTVSAKQGEQTLFLVEVKQAGAFVMQNLSAEESQARRRQHLPERAVPVRARRGFAARQPGRLSAAAAAAGEFRRAVRQLADRRRNADQKLGSRP